MYEPSSFGGWVVPTSASTLARKQLILGSAAALVVFGMLLVGSGCTTAVKDVRGLAGEKALLVYAKAGSAGSDPYLSTNADGGVPAYAPPDAGLASGAALSAGAISGAKPPAYEFRLTGPLTQTHYLNLSKPVSGVVYWSSAITQAKSTAVAYAVDNARVRAEVWAGNKFVGGGEWAGFYSIGGNGGGWQKLNLWFRPEVALLEKGEVLTLKVYRHSGLADFQIGTGGQQQTYLEFRYFDFDPLGGAMYLDRGRLYIFQDDVDSPQARAQLVDEVERMREEGRLDEVPAGLVVLPKPDRTDETFRLFALGAVSLLPAGAILAARPLPRRPTSFAAVGALLFILLALSGP
jgi:hypothetical protein